MKKYGFKGFVAPPCVSDCGISFALGNRSLLADPRNKDSKVKLNAIKKREWWRPVAPVLLEEDIHDWFVDVYPSPFMLHTFKIKESKNELIPAVMHIDDSSRLQTVNKSQNAILHELILTFKERTGIPVLCNTSLNDKGEPIIDKIDKAFNFALRKKIKVMYINGYHIELKNHDMYEQTDCEKRLYDFLLYQNEDERLKLLDRDNCLNLDKDLISQYDHYPYASEKYKFYDKNDMNIFKRINIKYSNKIKDQTDVKQSNYILTRKDN